ncbi:hypothetical protein XENORESO_020112 [Xenotaenia resolanae]|uniref:Uncharacterized protein n=1 Tax=Xenotaenia resolanae TaxID=208358 RepID=A0ABV0VZP8_9TELE
MNFKRKKLSREKKKKNGKKSGFIEHWLHLSFIKNTTCRMNHSFRYIHLDLVELDGQSPAQTKDSPAQCAGYSLTGSCSERVWMLSLYCYFARNAKSSMLICKTSI